VAGPVPSFWTMGAARRRIEPLIPEVGQGAQQRARHELRRRDSRDAPVEIVAGRSLLGEQLFGRHGQFLLRR